MNDDNLEDFHEFDGEAHKYNQIMEEEFGPNHKKYAEYKVELLHNLLPVKPNYSILNFGCGVGRDMDYFPYYFGNKISLYGCDVSKESVEYASALTNEYSYFQSEKTQSIYDQGVMFDIVFIACVLHHIDPIERKYWIKALADNTSDEGYICIFEHNLLNPMTKQKIMHPKTSTLDKLDWMLSMKEIINLFSDIGVVFKVYWKGYTLFSPVRRSLILNVEKYMGWCPFGAQQCVIMQKV